MEFFLAVIVIAIFAIGIFETGFGISLIVLALAFAIATIVALIQYLQRLRVDGYDVDYYKHATMKRFIVTLILAGLYVATIFVNDYYVLLACLSALLAWDIVKHYQKAQTNLPSPLRIPENVRPCYKELTKILNLYSESEIKVKIATNAQEHLCEFGNSGAYNTWEKDYRGALLNKDGASSHAYEKSCKSWAMCFIMACISRENTAPELCAYLRTELEKLVTNETFCPTAFLDFWSDSSNFIRDLYKKRTELSAANLGTIPHNSH